jgi:hypothetical protein
MSDQPILCKQNYAKKQKESKGCKKSLVILIDFEFCFSMLPLKGVDVMLGYDMQKIASLTISPSPSHHGKND